MIPDLALDVPEPARLGRVHLIAIGGAGMSAIARILLARGVSVSGSDARDSATLAELRALGARVEVGHRAEAVDGADTVVVSSAVRETNPELARARAAGLRVLHRSQALASLMLGHRAVAVAGTHGKTTTTSMVTVALRHCGADPSCAIGGDLVGGGAGAHHGSGEVFVAEADESDESFLAYRPQVAVITNVEPDHLDHYGTAERVEAAFDAFCDRILPGGLLVACADDPGASSVARRAAQRRGGELTVLGYGSGPGADVRVEALDGERWRLAGPDRPGAPGPVVEFALRVPGRHNALDAAAAWTAATWLGFDPDRVAEGLAGFGGARRRFEAVGQSAGVRVVDDYAHHPTEVAAVLDAARSVVGAGRVLAVFQPHLFSRTRLFAADFGAALGRADEVLVLDVYAAREDPEPGVSGRLVADAVPLPAERVRFLPDRAAVPEEIRRRARPGDLVLTVGAGDVTEIGPQILAALAEAGVG